jgi:hypothetical protein
MKLPCRTDDFCPALVVVAANGSESTSAERDDKAAACERPRPEIRAQK